MESKGIVRTPDFKNPHHCTCIAAGAHDGRGIQTPGWRMGGSQDRCPLLGILKNRYH